LTEEHLQEFIRIVEEWIRLYRSVGVAGRLPGAERRAELAVLHEQDAFYVQDLIDKIETLMREYEKKKKAIET